MIKYTVAVVMCCVVLGVGDRVEASRWENHVERHEERGIKTNPHTREAETIADRHGFAIQVTRASSTSDTEFVIAWNTSRPATSSLTYWKNDDEPVTVSVAGARTRHHEAHFSDLQTGDIYQYQISAQDRRGIVVASEILSFTVPGPDRPVIPPGCTTYAEVRRSIDLFDDPIEAETGSGIQEDIRIYTVPTSLSGDACLLLYSRGAPANSSDRRPRDVWEMNVTEDGALDIALSVGNTYDFTGDTVLVMDPYAESASLLIERNGEDGFVLEERVVLSGTETNIVSHYFPTLDVQEGDTVRLRFGEFSGRPASDVVVQFSSTE